MKKILSIMALILISSFLLVCLAACEPNDPDDDGTGDEVTGFDITDYTIVRSENAGDELAAACTALKNRIEKSANINLTITDDWCEDGEDTASKKEILVGATNRDATASAKAKLDGTNNKAAFIIEVVESKIVILGKSDDVTMRAVKYFATNFVSTSKKEGTLNIDASYSMPHVANMKTTIFPENLVEFSVSEKFSVYNHGEFYQTTTLQYPTAVYLQHQADEKNNGTMLATLNSSETFYRIFRSTDNGESWSAVTRVYETNPENLTGGTLIAGRMPFLYELPADVGEFKKGTIFLAGTSSPFGGTSASYARTAITMYYSTDLGDTWTYLPSVDYAEGRVDGEGVWEPFLIYEEETGRVYCFYSDDSEEKVPGKHDQKLVYKYSTDMKNWTGANGTGADSEPFEAVASETHTHRPGMIAISKMTNGEYILTYEFVGSKKDTTNSTTYYKTTTRLDDWGDPGDMGKIVITEDGETSGSGPWSAYTPVGGDNGVLFVFARFRGGYRSGDKEDLRQPDLFISFDYGRTYTSFDNPFKYNHIGNTDEDRTGYSVMMIPSPDGRTMYYFSNPPYGVTTQEIMMVRIDIIP